MNRVNWLCTQLLTTIAWCVGTIFAGCAHDTLVFNGEYLIPIQHLCKNASIVSFTSDWKFVTTTIRHRSVPHPCKQQVRLTLEGGESVTVQQHQKFLLFDTHEWTCAHYLMSGSRLVRIGSDPCVVVDVCEALEQYAYEMDVGGPHTFFITRWCILTHNADLSVVMTTISTDGILASVAGTSFCATLAAMLTSCGIKATVTGGTLSLTAPISGPFVLAACAGACAGYIFYQTYDWFYGLLSLSKVRDVIQFAERVKPSIIEQVQTGYQERYQPYTHRVQANQQITSQQQEQILPLSAQAASVLVENTLTHHSEQNTQLCINDMNTCNEHGEEKQVIIEQNRLLIAQDSLIGIHAPYVLLYQKQKIEEQNKRKKNRNIKNNTPPEKPPHNKQNTSPGVVDTLRRSTGGSIIVKTARDAYEFVKKQWQECKDACHNVISELSKLGKRCFKCKGPAFRANYKSNPKHGVAQRGNISPEPQSGEAAMYNSVAFDKENPRRRFGTSNGEIVEIKTSGNNPQNEYHGFVRQWETLDKNEKNFLIKNGLTDKRGSP